MTTEINRNWSTGLRQLAEIIGAAAAVRLVDVFGGTEQNYIPKKPTIGHSFVGIIGFDNMILLSAELGGETITIPRSSFRVLKKAQIIDLLLEGGRSSREIALTVGVHQRYVRMIKAELRDLDDEPAQLSFI